MQRHRAVTFVLGAVVLAAGCSDGGDLVQPEPAVQSPRGEGRPSEVTLLSIPDAFCTISPEGVDDPEQTADIYADYQGVVHFYANAASSTDAHPILSIACEEGNRIVVHSVDLRDPASFLPAVAPPTRAGPRIRPALGVNAAALSQAELRSAGYPARPDAVTAPALYAEWLRAVSRPVTLVTPKIVENPDVQTSSIISPTWAGNVMLSRPYAGIIANIPVPQVLFPTIPDTALVWAGLGGYISGDNSRIQAGVWFQATGSVAVYRLFFQYWRNNRRFITNVAIHPGDNIQTWISPCDDNLNFSMTGTQGCFFFEDTTTGVATSTSFPANSQNTPYSGGSAEFIVERLTVGIPTPPNSIRMSALVCGFNPDGSCRPAIFPGDALDTLDIKRPEAITFTRAEPNNITSVSVVCIPASSHCP